MENNTSKLVEELRDIRYIRTADILKRRDLQLTDLNTEIINRNIYNNLFEKIELDHILKNKIFGIN